MNAIGLIGLSVDIDFSLARAAIIYMERHIGRKIADGKWDRADIYIRNR